MSKNIIFCADGTWNGPGKDLEGKPVPTSPSNVLKLYHWLAGRETIESAQFSGESERVLTNKNLDVLQVVKYLDGVGYDDNWLVKLLGGVFGAGMITRIVRGYTFISRNYSPGDAVYIVGFSRGAYTARALAGLILDQGLLSSDNLTDKDIAYRNGCAAWYAHQKNRSVKKNASFLEQLEETVTDLPRFFSNSLPPSAFVKNIPIKALAVWDTVGALGIPEYDTHDARVDAFRFADTNLDPRVEFGFHALSLDEQRVDFTPTPWTLRTQIEQVLFSGAHADVGGSYPGDESGLSDCALVWMKEKTEQVGLLFDSKPDYIAPNPHDSSHQPWIYAPYKDFPPKRIAFRNFKDGQKLRPHDSLLARIGNPYQPDPTLPAKIYQPGNIPVP